MIRIPLLVVVLVLWTTSCFAAEWPALLELLEKEAIARPHNRSTYNELELQARMTVGLERLRERLIAGTKSSDPGKYYESLFQFHRSRGDTNEAVAAAIEATRVAPADFSAWICKAEAEAWLKRTEVWDSLRKAHSLASTQEQRQELFMAASFAASKEVPGVDSDALLEELSRSAPVEIRARLIAAKTSYIVHEGQAVARIAALRKACELGDAQAYVELAHLYETIGDRDVALETWEKLTQLPALQPMFLKDAAHAAQRLHEHEKAASYFEQFARLEPKGSNAWCQTFIAALPLPGGYDAARILKEHGPEILPHAAELRPHLGRIWGLDLALPLARLLSGQGRDFALRLLEGELWMMEGEMVKAEAAFWNVVEQTQPTEPRIPRTNWDAELKLAAILSVPISRIFSEPKVTQEPASARDAALLRIGILNGRTQTDLACLQRVETTIRDWPQSEQIAVWLMLQNVERLISALEAHFRNQKPDLFADAWCSTAIARFDPAQPRGSARLLTPDEITRLKPLKERFLLTLAPAVAETQALQTVTRQSAVHCAEALSKGDITAARQILEREGENFPFNDFAGLVWQKRDMWLSSHTADRTKLASLAAFTLAASSATPGKGESQLSPMTFVAPLRSFDANLQSSVSAIEKKLPAPPIGIIGRRQSEIFASLFQVIWKERGAPEFLESLKSEAAVAIAPEVSLRLRFMTAWAAWWAGDRSRAIEELRTLAAQTRHPWVLIGLANIEANAGQFTEAAHTLSTIELPYPEFRRFIDRARLSLLINARDATTATALALELVRSPHSSVWRRELAIELRQLGVLGEDAIKQLSADEPPPADPFSLLRIASVQLVEGKMEPAISIVTNLLGRTPLVGRRGGEQVKGEDFIAKQLSLESKGADQLRKAMELRAEKAGSADFWWQLAAIEIAPERKAAALRRSIKLEPRVELQWDMARLPSGTIPEEERLTLLDNVISRWPIHRLESIGEKVFNLYSEHGAVDRLFAQLARRSWKGLAAEPMEGAAGLKNFWTRLAFLLEPKPNAEFVSDEVRLYLGEQPQDAALKLARVDESLVLLGMVREPANAVVRMLADYVTNRPLFFAFVHEPVVSNPSFSRPAFELARRMNILPAVAEHARAAAAIGHGVARQVDALARVATRDPSIIKELEQTPAAAVWQGIEDLVARDLAGWPQASEVFPKFAKLAEEILAREMTFDKVVNQVETYRAAGAQEQVSTTLRSMIAVGQKSKSTQLTAKLLEKGISIAQQEHNEGEMADFVRLLVEQVIESPASTWRIALNVLRSLELSAPQRTELRAALEKAKDRATGATIQLQALDLESGAKRGVLSGTQPLVWLMDGDPTTLAAQLAWDLAGLGTPLIQGSLGERLVSEPRERRVRFLFDEKKDQLKPFAEFTTGKTRGIWNGTPPKVKGWIACEVEMDGRITRGPVREVSVGKNILPPIDADVPNWGLPANQWTRHEGGPIPKGVFLSERVRNSTAPLTEREYIGAAVPMKSGSHYRISVWVRVGPESNVGLASTTDGGRSRGYSNTQLRKVGAGEAGIWVELQTDAVSFNEKTMLAPVLTVSGAGCDIAGLSIRELPRVR